MLPATRFVELPPFAVEGERSVTFPKGFVAAGVATGVKKRGKLDLGILRSLRPAVSAATFTSNAAAAAPVRLTRETVACDRLQAVVVNAGNANACTGTDGLADAARMRLLTAQHLRLPVELVAVASTGVIGVPLEMAKIEPGIAAAAAALKPGGGEHFSQAIRTTDSSPKRGALELRLAEGVVRLGAAAKGCGMISPRMATMLCFVTCDAAVASADWHAILTTAVDRSFNRITVDGQESTNDTVVGMANGASGVRLGEAGLRQLAEALDALLLSLAVAMVADGEGATKAVRLTVDGARDAGEAERVARAVADSPLVKTAFFGRDANWGRIVQAAGQALGRAAGAAGGAACGTHAAPVPGGLPGATDRGCAPAATVMGAAATGAADVLYEDLAVVRGGRPVPLSESAQERLADIMAQHEIDLRVSVNGGSGTAIVYFSDLTHDYVTLNAEYTS